MKARQILLLSLTLACAHVAAQNKEVFIPRDLQPLNLNDTASNWCWERSLHTPNTIIFWEKGFGPSLATPPALEGKPMQVDLQNLAEKLETFYTFYRDSLRFTRHPEGKPSRADKYKMMTMVKYSLEATAYGGSYDGTIGALWVTPSRLQDKKLNVIAHELGHAFQYQVMADGLGDNWGGTGFVEMTSQWMLWQVNPDWVNDERYHWNAFRKQTHRAFMSRENIYRAPYVLEFWSEKHGLPVIADLYRHAHRDDDPALTYMKLHHLSQEQFCDEMYQASTRIVNLDFRHARPNTRKCISEAPVPDAKFSDADADGWQQIDSTQTPEPYGFNVITLRPDTREVRFQSASDAAEAGFRFGLVYTDEQGTRYGKLHAGLSGKIAKGEIKKLMKKRDTSRGTLRLVVMVAPTRHEKHSDTPYPYMVKIITPKS